MTTIDIDDLLTGIADELIAIAETLGPTLAAIDGDYDKRDRLLRHLATELEFEATLWVPSGIIDSLGHALCLSVLAAQRLVAPGPLRAPFDPHGTDAPSPTE